MRLLRYSSNPWDNDPEYVKELLRYNELHHHDYNPGLDSKTSKMIFEKLLNVPVKKGKQDFDRRYMVKPPDNEKLTAFKL